MGALENLPGRPPCSRLPRRARACPTESDMAGRATGRATGAMAHPRHALWLGQGWGRGGRTCGLPMAQPLARPGGWPEGWPVVCCSGTGGGRVQAPPLGGTARLPHATTAPCAAAAAADRRTWLAVDWAPSHSLLAPILNCEMPPSPADHALPCRPACVRFFPAPFCVLPHFPAAASLGSLPADPPSPLPARTCISVALRTHTFGAYWPPLPPLPSPPAQAADPHASLLL